MRSTKSLKGDLHTGFVVKTRNGELYAVVRTGAFAKVLCNYDHSMRINQYLSNLLAKPEVLSADLDVMEIYGLVRGSANPYEALRISTRNRPLLWVRREPTETKEEIV